MGDVPSRGRAGRIIPPGPQAEVDDELAFHLEQRVREYIARGMTPDAARAAALERFGNLDGVRTECTHMLAEDRRAAARRDWLDDLRQDFRFALRSAARSPMFTLLAILTLALGIGANAAVFGVTKSVLLDALPYGEADRLVRIYSRFLDGSHERGPLSAGSLTDIAERQRSFTDVAGFMGQTMDAVFGRADAPSVEKLSWVQPGLFRTLGVQAAVGRTFRDDDVSPDTARVVVVAHGAWQRLFGGDSAIVGREIRLNSIPRTVIGVLPPGFVSPAGEADFFLALNLEPSLRDPVRARGSHWLGMVARLRPGVTHEAAAREIAAIGSDLAREHPQDNASIAFVTMPLRDAMVGDTRTPLLVLMASAALVLLVTCANLAGALLSRTISRRREFAVRVALGAGRGRLVRQLLTESTILAVAGAAAGLLLAFLGLELLRGLASTALPTYADLSLDRGAIAVTFAIALCTGLAFGVGPAISVGRADPQGTLRDETRGTSESTRSRRLRGMLVAGQIALCVSLLAGAGLLARSLWAMATASLGFRAEGVLTAAVYLSGQRYATDESLYRFYEQLEERVRRIPGVQGFAMTNQLPTRVGSRNGISIVGAPAPAGEAVPFVLYASVSDDYFRVAGVPLRRGRTFEPGDRADTPPVLVISESMASRFWPRGDAIGSRIRMGPDPNSTPIEVVGIVGDVRNDLARADAEPMAYGSFRQLPDGDPILMIRTAGDPLALVKPLHAELAAIDPAQPLDRVATLRDLVDEGLAGRRLPVMLMTAFGVLALILASVGVYALFATMAAAREREFGVRIALGSSARGIAGLVLRQGAVWMAAGLAGGAVGVVLVARMLRGLLYGIAPLDPIALGVAVLLLVVCAAVALLVPVRRATSVDPVSVLR